MAEGEGFEPPVPCGTPVFKTGAFDHSAILPQTRYYKILVKNLQVQIRVVNFILKSYFNVIV